MIYKEGKEVTAVYRCKKVVTDIYKKGKLVWQAVRSCFGSGSWNNEKPWSNSEGWNNG